MGSERNSARMARSAREEDFRTAAGACAFCVAGCRSVISGRGVRGMAHCGVEGEAGAMARRVEVPPAVGESGGVARADNGLVGLRGMVEKLKDGRRRNGFLGYLRT
jgi:hypothetical protein